MCAQRRQGECLSKNPGNYLTGILNTGAARKTGFRPAASGAKTFPFPTQAEISGPKGKEVGLSVTGLQLFAGWGSSVTR
jgi:hypothetical protein